MLSRLIIKTVRPLFLAIYVLLSIAVSGCIPGRFSGYAPSGPGTLERRYCAGPGIRDVLRISADAGVTIEIMAGQNRSAGSITLDVSLIIPETVTVQLLAPQFLLQSREWTEPRILPVNRLMGPGPKPGPNIYGPTDKLIGPQGLARRYSFWFLDYYKGALFQTGVPIVNSFTLQFPPININGRRYRIDPISFEAYDKWSIYTCVQ